MKNNTDKSSNRLLNIISLLLCILLWSAGLAENAILSVPTAKTPPTIDGEMDAIWARQPRIGHGPGPVKDTVFRQGTAIRARPS